MKKLSMPRLIANKNKHFLSLAAFGTSLCLVASLASVNGVSALDQAADISAKIAVGAPNDEAITSADPIRNCGPAPADKDPSAWGKFFKVNYVNMRRSPNPTSRICGQGQKSHRVDYHCYKVGSDGHTWTYLRDVNTHYAGWVRDNLLVGNGSLVHC